MEFAVLGWPADGPTIELDWRRFAYAGKFVMSSTGKTVSREDDEIVGAIAFSPDRSVDTRVWIRYVTVREDRRAAGIGARLIDFTAERLLDRYETVRTGATNPYSFEAFVKAGFGFTGEEAGMEALVLERPAPAEDDVNERYRDGFRRFEARDLTEDERVFVEEHLAAGQPHRVHYDDSSIDPTKGEY